MDLQDQQYPPCPGVGYEAGSRVPASKNCLRHHLVKRADSAREQFSVLWAQFSAYLYRWYPEEGAVKKPSFVEHALLSFLLLLKNEVTVNLGTMWPGAAIQSYCLVGCVTLSKLPNLSEHPSY